MRQEKMHLALRELKKVKNKCRSFDELEKIHNEYYKNTPYFVNFSDYQKSLNITARELLSFAPVIAWSYAKLIYKFDEDAEVEIKQSKLTDTIPCDIFHRMPAWSIFIETSNLFFGEKKVNGFYVMLDNVGKLDGEVLWFVFHFNNIDFPYMLPLINGKTLTESIALARERLLPSSAEGEEKFHNFVTKALLEAISLLLFICTQNDQINRHSVNKVPTKRNGFTIENDVVFNDVAVTIGNAIRLNKTESQERESRIGSHKSKRPHIRRAHWHGYWSGKKDNTGNRKYELKWLPPFAVGMKNGTEIPVVIHKIKK
ncbi:AcrVA2 family anti-CRISPR protein [Pasteurella sp. PK-2025]|uniref:AcrVA2 family anti-CRISPR protein n=1 Tax=Pasteurella sp. PK-2025 TaxID=3413133 RepID=UPI003C733268